MESSVEPALQFKELTTLTHYISVYAASSAPGSCCLVIVHFCRRQAVFHKAFFLCIIKLCDAFLFFVVVVSS